MSDADIVERLRQPIVIYDARQEIMDFLDATSEAADEITSLRTELAATPQWRDKPTCVGRWLCEGRVVGIVEYELDEFLFNDALKHGCDEHTRWYGPIPTDTPKETGK